jgi:hypothetical protein
MGHASNFSCSLHRYWIQSLGHACIFSTSKPKGQRTLLASYVDADNLFPSGSMSFTINNNSSKVVSDVLPTSCAPLCNLGTTVSWDLLTYVQISLTPSPFHRNFFCPSQHLTESIIWSLILSHFFVILFRWFICKGTTLRPVTNSIIILFVIFHYNPLSPFFVHTK